MIRPACASDCEAIRGIERAAGQRFQIINMAAVAEDEPPTADEILAHVALGQAWVATAPGRRTPVGYILVDVLDDLLDVHQVSVDLVYPGRRIGASLVDTAGVWAVGRGLGWLTLTTFRDVPWNAPYYARLGFEVVDDARLPAALATIRQQEKAVGLDRWPRVAMRRPATRW